MSDTDKMIHPIIKICSRLEKQGIKYCHFKSNQHLDVSFQGKTDFDILVEDNKKAQAEIIIKESGCKKFEYVKSINYPGVEHRLIIDRKTGVIFHIHLHYQLVSGMSNVKEYIIPWGEMILDTAIRSPVYGIMIADPNVEMLLLLTRIVIKAKKRTDLMAFFGQFKLSRSMQIEYDYLRERSDTSTLEQYAKGNYNSNTIGIMLRLLHNNKYNAKTYMMLKKCIRKELRIHKRIPTYKANWKKFYMSLVSMKEKICRKLKRFSISRKVSASGGKIIAFIGADGSGKSTVCKDVAVWLSGNIEAKDAYMGTGAGSRNITARAIRNISQYYMKKGRGKIALYPAGYHTPQEKKKITIFSNPVRFLKKLAQCLVILSVAKGNRRKLISANLYRANGGFCILDRYPQIQIDSINDGPKIKKYADETNSRLIRYLARREAGLMKIVQDVKPDIVFRLNISIETCMNRKAEHTDRGYFEHKLKANKQIQFPDSILYEIDADKRYVEEILLIKNLIWDHID